MCSAGASWRCAERPERVETMTPPALDLEFAPRRARWPAWLLLAAGLAVAADVTLTWSELRSEARTLEQPRGARRPAASNKAPLPEAVQREFDAARQALQELALPWEALFQAIEGATSNDTALLAIEPDPGKRALRIGGEARDFPAVLGYVERLAAQPVLAGVHLVTHQVREDVAERPVQFTLLATWRAQP